MTELSLEEKLVLENFLLALRPERVLKCAYKNYKGVVSERTFQPVRFWFGVSDWHDGAGLFLKAYDLGKQDMRDFKMEDFNLSTLRRG